MAIAGQMSAAAARRCTRSASAIVRRRVTGFHDLTIDGCAASRKTPILQSAASRPFDAAGHRWRIRYFPNGSWWTGGGYMSLFLELHEDHGSDGGGDDVHVNGNDDPVEFTFTVLDPAGNPVPKYSRSKEEFFFSGGASASSRGFPNFVRWKDLEASGCLKDDKFTVRCDIAVRKEWTEDTANDDGGDDNNPAAPHAHAVVVVPPSDLREHLGDLLWKKQGTDVTIYVGGGQTAYDAHGWLLAARSPVFEAELLAAAKEKVPGGGVRRHVEVQGVEPRVFKAMLHYMYTDTLPPEMWEKPDAVAMAQGLLEAAHRYKLHRLRLMCEEMLCERIDMDTVAGSLAVAKQHGCQVLEAMCVEFISRPGNLGNVMETEGFEKIKASCPELLIELLMKRLA